MRRTRTVAAVSLVIACIGGVTAPAANAHTKARVQLSGDITVFAAASLTEAFTAIAHDFTRAHPHVHVTFSFGASNVLASQITSGAPADVFASASNATMEQVVAAADVTKPTTFARNTMIIVTPPDNPANVRSLHDLANPSVSVAVCQALVPCGVTARNVFAKSRIHLTPVTNEVDVKSVLTKVELGEVDAGVVYVTDAYSAGASVTSVAIPARWNSETSYPIAAVRSSTNPSVARAFIAFVRSATGQRRLAAVGFARA